MDHLLGSRVPVHVNLSLLARPTPHSPVLWPIWTLHEVHVIHRWPQIQLTSDYQSQLSTRVLRALINHVYCTAGLCWLWTSRFRAGDLLTKSWWTNVVNKKILENMPPLLQCLCGFPHGLHQEFLDRSLYPWPTPPDCVISRWHSIALGTENRT